MRLLGYAGARNAPLALAWRICVMNPFDKEGAFGPKTLAILSRAYDDARREIRDPRLAEQMQEVLARRVLDHARTGERDPSRLKAHCLRGLIRSC